MKLTLRTKVAIGLGLIGIFSLFPYGEFHPIGWRDWIVMGWVLGKIGFLVYAAYLLIIADEEVETWKSRSEGAERDIQRIVNKSNFPEHH
jgi:hypothetical protein